nr:unnamed protein product [Callosobruchus chinensis]
MKMYMLLLTVCIWMPVSTAEQEFHKESVPVCGNAFLVTNQYPNYYDRKIEQTYEAMKDRDSKIVAQTINTKLAKDSQQLGQNKFYFQRCKYAKCRYRLDSDMLATTSKALANNLSDTKTGLEKAYAALTEKYKNTTRVKRFGGCLGL